MLKVLEMRFVWDHEIIKATLWCNLFSKAMLSKKYFFQWVTVVIISLLLKKVESMKSAESFYLRHTNTCSQDYIQK